MIESRDLTGFGVAVLGHAALIAAALFLIPRDEKPVVPDNEPIQVTLSDDVSLVSAAPDPSTEAPAQAAAGEDVPPDTEIAPPPPPSPEPDKPKPTPPRQNPDAAKQPPAPPASSKRPPQTPGTGRPKPGLNLDDSTLRDGQAPQKSPGTSNQSQATMTGAASQNINSAILRQVQPCADRQVIPAAEARKIFVRVELTFNRDGSLASLRIVGHDNVDDSNRRYVDRVDDAVEAIFRGCTPIRGLPAELYDVTNGWKSRKFRYQLSD